MPEDLEEPLNAPVLLAKNHTTAGFDCGKPPLNDFLTKYALQNQVSGGARTYVLTRADRVIGYFSLAPASVSPEDAPSRVVKGPVPGTRYFDGMICGGQPRTRERVWQSTVS